MLKKERFLPSSPTYDPQALCCVYRSESPGRTPRESPIVVSISMIGLGFCYDQLNCEFVNIWGLKSHKPCSLCCQSPASGHWETICKTRPGKGDDMVLEMGRFTSSQCSARTWIVSDGNMSFVQWWSVAYVSGGPANINELTGCFTS